MASETHKHTVCTTVKRSTEQQSIVKTHTSLGKAAKQEEDFLPLSTDTSCSNNQRKCPAWTEILLLVAKQGCVHNPQPWASSAAQCSRCAPAKFSLNSMMFARSSQVKQKKRKKKHCWFQHLVRSLWTAILQSGKTYKSLNYACLFTNVFEYFSKWSWVMTKISFICLFVCPLQKVPSTWKLFAMSQRGTDLLCWLLEPQRFKQTRTVAN